MSAFILRMNKVALGDATVTAMSHVLGFSHIFALLRLQLHGMMRVILEPLIGDVPIVGAVTMFFIKRPVRLLALTSTCLPVVFFRDCLRLPVDSWRH